MLSRPLAIVAAIAILTSLFLPWLSSPFGENVVPWTVLRALDAEGAQAILADARPETIAYGCSFVLAAMFILFALIGRESRLLAFLTGVLPVALVAWALFLLLRQPDGSLSFSGSDTSGVTTRMLGAGAWAWVLGASTLATLGVVDPGRRPVRYA
ncbi:hypothetical protein [Rhodobacter sp. SY28-1]|uniref:hypothetical protein n=1 Tax=Rhodobacter sp. SY28-1 TaxID=2562317 RepID=UPI0010C10130|nr:hypothetical protein [Rhodobacter sp. SY28-1]